MVKSTARAMPPRTNSAPNIGAVAQAFVQDVNSISYAYPVTLLAFKGAVDQSIRDLAEIMKEYSEPAQLKKFVSRIGRKKSSSSLSLDIPSHASAAVTRKISGMIQVLGGRNLVQRSFIFEFIPLRHVSAKTLAAFL